MAFEFFQDGLFLFDEYTFNQLDNNETISGTYNLDVQVKDKIYQAKFAIIINVDCKNLTKIPEVYLPKLSIPFKFEHIYKDRKNLCCLGLNYEIELAWGPKRSFSNFLTLVVDPFLVNYLEFKENKKYINGERPHAKNGLIDYYSQFFTSISTNKIIDTLMYCYNKIKRKEFAKGNNLCPCGSGQILRHCNHWDEIKTFINKTSQSKTLKLSFENDIKNYLGDENGKKTRKSF